MNKAYDRLKAKQRAERHFYSTNQSLRVHRALSWLLRAEFCDDLDRQFLFLWIAFNAVYAQDFYNQEQSPERTQIGHFLYKLDRRSMGTLSQQ